MKDFFLSDCPRFENKVITSSFVVTTKQVKPKKTGEPYLALTLADRCGQIEAKMWDNVEDALDAFEQDDFLKIKGLLNKYKNRFQYTIHKLRRMADSEVDLRDTFLTTAESNSCSCKNSHRIGGRCWSSRDGDFARAWQFRSKAYGWK